MAVLDLMMQDLSVKQVASMTGRSVLTIQNQVRNAKLKLHCGTSHGLIAKYLNYDFTRRENTTDRISLYGC